MSNPNAIWRLATLLWCAGFAAAQSPTTVAREGESVAGAGLIQTVDNLLLESGGDWLGILETDADNDSNLVMLRNGSLIRREGDALVEPPDSILSNLRNALWELDRNGNLAYLVRITGPEITPHNDQVLYWNDRLLLQERTFLNAPQVDPATIWKKAFAIGFIESQEQVLVWSELDDPTLPNVADDALLRLQLDEVGNVLEREVLVVEGQVLPGPGAVVFRSFPIDANPHFGAVNPNGDFLWVLQGENGEWEIRRGLEEVVAFKGLAFSAPGNPRLDGRVIENFLQTEVDLNDWGDFVYNCRLNGAAGTALAETNQLIVVNGAAFAQEGEALPALNGATLDNNTNSPLRLANSGDLFWTAALRDATPFDDKALMRNKQVVLRRGVSAVGTDLVTDIRTTANSLDITPDGRFLLAEVVLNAGLDALVLVDFGAIVPVPGSGLNPGTLERSVDSAALAGESFQLAADGAQAPGVTSVFFLSPRPAQLLTPVGELLVGTPFNIVQVGPLWNGNPVLFDVDIPADTALVDSVWYGQCAFVDVAGSLPGADITLTNGIQLTVGAP